MKPTADPKHETQGDEHLAFWSERLTAPSYVYVLQTEPNTPIKVGLATDVRARMASLQTGNPQTLRLLYVVPGDRRLEWNWHVRLKGDRVHGEWFEGMSVKAFLTYVGRLAQRMVNAYDDSGVAPDYADFGIFDLQQPLPEEPELERAQPPLSIRERKRRRREMHRAAPIARRRVEPDPVIDPVVAQEMRDRVAGMSPSAYLGPANQLMHKQISPNAGYN